MSLLTACARLGISRFDTGPTYGGDGLAEIRLGVFLAQNRAEKISISTKVGTHRDNKGRLFKDYSASALRSSLEASLNRLGTTSVDLVLLHGPINADDLTQELIDAVGQLRDAGLTRRIGASCDGTVARKLVQSRAFDVLMTTYNTLDTSNAPAMAAAKQADMAVVVKAPLAHGAAQFPRRPLLRRTNSWYNARLLARRPQLIASALRQRGNDLTPTTMLDFVAAEPTVDAIVIGTTSEYHLRANAHTIAAAGDLPSS